MGWRFRRSKSFGPFHVNLSQRGAGASWGLPGFRLGKSADGRSYVSLGIPGTGLYWIKHFGKRAHSKADIPDRRLIGPDR